MAASPEQPASRLSPNSDDSSPESEDESSDVAAASLRVFTESAARTEVEMARSRESARARAETLRAELETELTQFVLQTQLRIAGFVAKAGSDRKRKKPGAENDDLSPTHTDRERVLLLNLLQCDMIL